MQSDWISVILASAVPVGYSSGQSLKIDPWGEVREVRPVALDVEDDEPSSSRRFRVWTPSTDRLYLSGNPVKLLQGHNCWGSCDCIGLTLAAGAFVRQRVGLFPGPETWDSCGFKVDHFTRLDVTRSYRFPTHSQAQAFIREVAGSSRSRHGASRLYGSETAMFGQGSRRWSFKVYDKFAELQKSLVKGEVDSRFVEWAEGVVRFELTLRGMELEALDLHQFRGSETQWRLKLFKLWRDYYGRITWSGGVAMAQANDNLLMNGLPSGARAALMAWRLGGDVRQDLQKATFYRYRRAILEAVGVDIRSAPQRPVSATPAAPLGLDADGWDPEPLEVAATPSEALKAQYGLI
jgi:II/X family phage/plasmid replication protein